MNRCERPSGESAMCALCCEPPEGLRRGVGGRSAASLCACAVCALLPRFRRIDSCAMGCCGGNAALDACNAGIDLAPGVQSSAGGGDDSGSDDESDAASDADDVRASTSCSVPIHCCSQAMSALSNCKHQAHHRFPRGWQPVLRAWASTQWRVCRPCTRLLAWTMAPLGARPTTCVLCPLMLWQQHPRHEPRRGRPPRSL